MAVIPRDRCQRIQNRTVKKVKRVVTPFSSQNSVRTLSILDLAMRDKLTTQSVKDEVLSLVIYHRLHRQHSVDDDDGLSESSDDWRIDCNSCGGEESARVDLDRLEGSQGLHRFPSAR